MQDLYQSLGHPGYAKLYHFVRQRNVPFSSEERKGICRNCKTCAEVKPLFFQPASRTLIKAVRPWDRESIDFKGPVRGPLPYLLIVVDECSRFPFVIPCANMTSSTFTDCLSSFFCFLSVPSCIHSDRAAPFVSRETQSFLTERGIAFSTSTPYHPQGNSQCERMNQALWRTIKLWLHGKRLSEERWESVLLEALHAIRSLVCLATNEIPHERLFCFSRKATFGAALPSWLLAPGTVLLRRFVRNNGEPLYDPVEQIEANGHYSVIRHRYGQESTVSTSDLAPYPRPHEVKIQRPFEAPVLDNSDVSQAPDVDAADDCESGATPRDGEPEVSEDGSPAPNYDSPVPMRRRSTRQRRPPDHYGDWTV